MFATVHQREAPGAVAASSTAQSSAESPPPNTMMPLAGKLLGIAHPVLDAVTLEGLAPGHREPPRLERTQSRGNHHRARGQFGAAGRAHLEVTRAIGQQRRDLLAQMELGIERTDLLHQPVHQFLGTAHR